MPMQKAIAPVPDPVMTPIQSVVVVLDVTQPGSPKEVYRETAPGMFWTARGIGNRVAWVNWRDVPIYEPDLKDDEILPQRAQKTEAGSQNLPAVNCTGAYLYQNDTLNADYVPYSLNTTTVSFVQSRVRETSLVMVFRIPISIGIVCVRKPVLRTLTL